MRPSLAVRQIQDGLRVRTHQPGQLDFRGASCEIYLLTVCPGRGSISRVGVCPLPHSRGAPYRQGCPSPLYLELKDRGEGSPIFKPQVRVGDPQFWAAVLLRAVLLRAVSDTLPPT